MNILKVWFKWLYGWKEPIEDILDSNSEFNHQKLIFFRNYESTDLFLLDLISKGLLRLDEEGYIIFVKASALKKLTEDQKKVVLDGLVKSAFKETK